MELLILCLLEVRLKFFSNSQIARFIFFLYDEKDEVNLRYSPAMTVIMKFNLCSEDLLFINIELKVFIVKEYKLTLDISQIVFYLDIQLSILY